MYQYVTDKAALSHIRNFGGGVMQELCHLVKEQYGIGANFFLVGSGARNLILQNESGPIDLDYNLMILKCKDIRDCRTIKENVKKAFNCVLKQHGWEDCQDSVSSLRTKKQKLFGKDVMTFSMDLCIVCKDEEGYLCRLIHEMTGRSTEDKYHWDRARDSCEVNKKADFIRKAGKWLMVREEYIKIKNKYLTQNNHDHPSFICYIEAVNNVYNTKQHWKN